MKLNFFAFAFSENKRRKKKKEKTERGWVWGSPWGA